MDNLINKNIENTLSLWIEEGLKVFTKMKCYYTIITFDYITMKS